MVGRVDTSFPVSQSSHPCSELIFFEVSLVNLTVVSDPRKNTFADRSESSQWSVTMTKPDLHLTIAWQRLMTALLLIFLVSLAGFLPPRADASPITADMRSSKTKIGPALQARLNRVGPGETVPVIVRLQDRVDIRPMAVPTREKGPRRAAARAAMIKSLKERANRSRQPLQNLLQRHGVVKQRDLWLINAVAVDATPDLIGELMLLPEVESVVVDAPVELPEAETLAVSGPAQPNVALVNAPDLWALGYAGQGVTVAIVDSGVDVNHPDLAPTWRGGSNSWFDPNGEHPWAPVDVDGHGTQVAGLVLGGQNSGQYLGVAPAAQWIGVKIFADSGLAPRSSIHAGYQWLLDPDSNPDTDDAPDIVNNSWGFESTPDVCDATAVEFQTDLQVLRAAGMAVVFAAGNTGPAENTSTPPANYPESFAVGSVGTFGSSTLISDFSARGPSACDNTIYPELVAPGFLVWTTDLTEEESDTSDFYTHVAGTSFATPHVSGIMALLLSAFPGLPLDELEQALTQSATDLGDVGPDNSYGFGLVNALAAYRLLDNQTANTPPVAPQLVAPSDKATVDPDVTFRWLPASDADGDSIAQFLVYSTQADFATETTRQVDSVPAAVQEAAACGLIGLLVAGLLRRRHRWTALLVFAVLITILTSCGGGGGGDDPAVVEDSPVLAGTESLTISGLMPGTTYYWKMIARDSRGAETESSVWSFQVR